MSWLAQWRRRWFGKVGFRVGPDVVDVGRLVQIRDELHRVVEHGDDVREGVAEEAGDAHGHVDTGPSEFGRTTAPSGAQNSFRLDENMGEVCTSLLPCPLQDQYTVYHR